MAWVLTIVRNLALMKLREKEGRNTSFDEQNGLEADGGFAENSLDKLVLQAALTVLSNQERQIVMLHCVSGQRHREIAELLGIPLGTALSKYRRALIKLQNYLKEEA